MQLNTAQKCVKQVWPGPTKCQIIRPLFNLESPTFAGTSTPTLSMATPDITSPATSGQHSVMFEKMAENVISVALDLISPKRFKQGS